MEKDRQIYKNDFSHIVYAVIYMAIMAAGMYVSYHVFGYDYDNPKIDTVLIYFEFPMSVYAICVYIKNYKGTSFNKLKMTFSFVMFSVLMILLMVFYLIQGTYKQESQYFIYVVITTIFVAFSEEVMYRGIVLSGFLKKYTIVKAIVYSSILFALLHTVNILGGESIKSMLIQLANTFILGIVLACFRVKNKNIIPLILYHFIWDIILISSPFVERYLLLITAIVGVSIVFAILLPSQIYKQDVSDK